MNGGAVFNSVQQALHFSFLLEVMPAVAKSQMQALLEHLLEATGRSNELEPHERTIDFGGLTALEIRGQCALVVGAVNTHLATPEQAAVWTRYGMRQRQAQGVDGLAEYVGPMLSCSHSQAHKAMIWGRFGTFEGRCGQRRFSREEFSIRKIASEFGLAFASVQRDLQRIVTCHKHLESRAVQRLEPYFVKTGLVGEYGTLQSP